MEITDLVYIDSTGYHFSDYPSFLAWIQEKYRGIYGADIYLEPDSQDGQFLAILAQSFYDVAGLGSSVYNSFSPATAQGVGLSRNVKINGLERQVPSRSTAEVTLVGQGGTVLEGRIAIDTLEQKWDIPTTTIPGGGSVVATAVAQEEGALAAAADTINTMFNPTLGWQSVNNDADATPGAPVENDGALRARQAVSTANPSLTVFSGTIGAVGNLSGVTKVRGYENDEDDPDADGLPGHSVSVCVVGGDDQEIADEINLHKTPGTQTFGNTTKTCYDAHGMPLEISFNRPTTVTISAVITISTNVGWSNDYIPLIQAAVAAVLNAGRIGDTILLTKLYAPAYLGGTAAGGTYDIATIEIGADMDPPAASNIVLTYNENPVCDPDTDVSVVIT